MFNTPNEELLKVFDSTTTPKGGALETLDFDMIVDACKG